MNTLNPILGLALVVSACQEQAKVEHVSVRDSVGIQIVESHGPQWRDSTPWTIADSPLLDLTLSGTGPSHEFYMVRGGLRLSDGRLVVANDGSSEVRIYSSGGHFIGATGQNGEGPGEFRRMGNLTRMRGDSIVVFDVLLNRLTILSSTGELGRVLSLRGKLDQARKFWAYDDSTFIGFSAAAGVPSEPGRYRIPYNVVHLGQNGAIEDTLGIIPGNEGVRSATVDGPLPFSKDGHLAIQGGEYVLGSADSLAFDRYRGPGALIQRVRVPGFQLWLSEEQTDSARDAMRPPENRPAPPDVLQLIESMPIPSFKPGYSRLLMDSEGFVWAGLYHRRVHAGFSVEWEVFSPGGEWMGCVKTPPGLTVFEIGQDYILGVRRDELDIEHVELLRLGRSG